MFTPPPPQFTGLIRDGMYACNSHILCHERLLVQ